MAKSTAKTEARTDLLRVTLRRSAAGIVFAAFIGVFISALHLVVRPENPNAIALYASQGFETIPRKIMTKKL